MSGTDARNCVYFVDDLRGWRKFHLPVLSLPACREVEVRDPHTSSADKNVIIPSLIHFPENERLDKSFLVRFIVESNASKPYQPIVYLIYTYL